MQEGWPSPSSFTTSSAKACNDQTLSDGFGTVISGQRNMYLFWRWSLWSGHKQVFIIIIIIIIIIQHLNLGWKLGTKNWFKLPVVFLLLTVLRRGSGVVYVLCGIVAVCCGVFSSYVSFVVLLLYCWSHCWENRQLVALLFFSLWLAYCLSWVLCSSSLCFL